jgi:hypothetical protein
MEGFSISFHFHSRKLTIFEDSSALGGLILALRERELWRRRKMLTKARDLRTRFGVVIVTRSVWQATEAYLRFNLQAN